MYSAPPLAAVWSLLTFYHLTYGFILLLPAAMLLMFAGDSRTSTRRAIMLSVLQLALMVDVPGVWRRVGHLFARPEIANALLPHFDRVLMAVAFACLAALYGRERLRPLRRAGACPEPGSSFDELRTNGSRRRQVTGGAGQAGDR